MIEYLRKCFIHCVYFVYKSVKFTVKYSTFFISNSVWKDMNNVIALINCQYYERTFIYCSKVIFSRQFFTKPGLNWPLVLNDVNITSTYALSFDYFEDHCRDSRIWCSSISQCINVPGSISLFGVCMYQSIANHAVVMHSVLECIIIRIIVYLHYGVLQI